MNTRKKKRKRQRQKDRQSHNQMVSRVKKLLNWPELPNMEEHGPFYEEIAAANINPDTQMGSQTAFDVMESHVNRAINFIEDYFDDEDDFDDDEWDDDDYYEDDDDEY